MLKIGDRVRVVNVTSAFNNQLGKVEKIVAVDAVYPIIVLLDKFKWSGQYDRFSADELEKINE